MAISSINTILEYSSNGTTWTEITKVISIPEIGGTPETIDVTTLTDAITQNIAGVQTVGALEFTLLFNNANTSDNYRLCKALEISGAPTQFRVTFADGTAVTFTATASTRISGAEVNAAIQFVLALFVQSAFVVTNPTAPNP